MWDSNMKLQNSLWGNHTTGTLCSVRCDKTCSGKANRLFTNPLPPAQWSEHRAPRSWGQEARQRPPHLDNPPTDACLSSWGEGLQTTSPDARKTSRAHSLLQAVQVSTCIWRSSWLSSHMRDSYENNLRGFLEGSCHPYLSFLPTLCWGSTESPELEAPLGKCFYRVGENRSPYFTSHPPLYLHPSSSRQGTRGMLRISPHSKRQA